MLPRLRAARHHSGAVSMSVNELLAEVQAADASLKAINRLRWAAVTVGSFCSAGLPFGIAFGAMPDLLGAPIGMILSAICIGFPLLGFGAWLGMAVVDEKEKHWKAEAKYHDALNRDLGGVA